MNSIFYYPETDTESVALESTDNNGPIVIEAKSQENKTSLLRPDDETDVVDIHNNEALDSQTLLGDHLDGDTLKTAIRTVVDGQDKLIALDDLEKQIHAGVSKTEAVAIESYFNGLLNDRTIIESFTPFKSQTQLSVVQRHLKRQRTALESEMIVATVAIQASVQKGIFSIYPNDVFESLDDLLIEFKTFKTSNIEIIRILSTSPEKFIAIFEGKFESIAAKPLRNFDAGMLDTRDIHGKEAEYTGVVQDAFKAIMNLLKCNHFENFLWLASHPETELVGLVMGHLDISVRDEMNALTLQSLCTLFSDDRINVCIMRLIDQVEKDKIFIDELNTAIDSVVDKTDNTLNKAVLEKSQSLNEMIEKSHFLQGSRNRLLLVMSLFNSLVPYFKTHV